MMSIAPPDEAGRSASSRSPRWPARLKAAALIASFGAGLAASWHQVHATAGADPGATGDPISVEIGVVDAEGRPLEQAVVWAEPLSGQVLPTAAVAATARIEQRDKAFQPGVLPVRVGTSVSFPNLDTVRHHVYSFSPAKVFSLKLYLGTPAEPVVFDKPGEIVLGCNIHDGMLAYVMALETPFFAKTGAAGAARLAGLPPGDYAFRAWHPSQSAAAPVLRLKLDGRASARVEHRIATKPGPRTVSPSVGARGAAAG